ncbi:MAG TPA: cation diffusion facilitator family transporter [Pirellulales bacterium]|jgi:cobalt-zinc-cadmium efflux system protein|nr:cation diffusion facilitator family transporter [Pirellulales bacterium]
MGAGHSHHHANAARASQSKMARAILMTLVFVAMEATAGLFAHSLALISDAGHNFADAAALGLSWYALWIAKKPSHQGMTYGYHRVGILAALVNAVSLVVIALVIVWEAINRLQHPESVNGGAMIVVALVGAIVNIVISIWLHTGAKDDLNVRSAYLHMVGDALSAIGVIIAGIVVTLTGSHASDVVASFLIAGLILYTSWDVLKESLTVLLEGTPVGMDIGEVEKTIASVPGVLNVHDLHVWTVGPGVIACTCHILVAEQSIHEGHQILKAVVTEVEHHFQINHTTVQVEVEGHDGCQKFCSVQEGSR